jgi:hypothetical protein
VFETSQLMQRRADTFISECAGTRIRFATGHTRELVAIEEGFQSDGSALANANGLSPKGATPPVQDGIDMSAGTVPPFRERAPWFGGDLQTLRNVMRGAPPDLDAGHHDLSP